MNQNVSPTEDLLSEPPLPPGGETSYWAMLLDMLLDMLLVLAPRWKLLVVGPLLAGAIAYAGAFLLPRSYVSYAYVGPLDDGTARKSSVLITSPVVLDPVLRKLSQPPFSSMNLDDGRRYLAKSIRFKPAQGADPKSASLYDLQVVDTEPSRARDILTAVVESWLAAMKPPPDKLASLERLRESLELQLVDLSRAIAQLIDHPELLRPDLRTGYAPVNIAEMIKLRSEGTIKSEELRSSIAGLSKDAIALPPVMPVGPVALVKRWIALAAAGITFVGLVAILLTRSALAVALARPRYAQKLRRLVGAFHRGQSPAG